LNCLWVGRKNVFVVGFGIYPAAGYGNRKFLQAQIVVRADIVHSNYFSANSIAWCALFFL